jgi:hypothetical protein
VYRGDRPDSIRWKPLHKSQLFEWSMGNTRHKQLKMFNRNGRQFGIVISFLTSARSLYRLVRPRDPCEAAVAPSYCNGNIEPTP